MSDFITHYAVTGDFNWQRFTSKAAAFKVAKFTAKTYGQHTRVYAVNHGRDMAWDRATFVVVGNLIADFERFTGKNTI